MPDVLAVQRGRMTCECGFECDVTSETTQWVYEEHVMDAHAPTVRYKWDSDA